MTMLYPIVFETEESGAVSAYVPGLPVYAAADSQAKAERAVRTVLAEYLGESGGSDEGIALTLCYRHLLEPIMPPAPVLPSVVATRSSWFNSQKVRLTTLNSLFSHCCPDGRCRLTACRGGLTASNGEPVWRPAHSERLIRRDPMLSIRDQTFGALALLFLVEAVVFGQADYRYERRPTPGEQLVYEMRTRTEGAPGELVAKLRVIAREHEGRVHEEVKWLSVSHTVTGPRQINLAPYDLLANPRTVIASSAVGDNTDIVGLVTDLYTLFFAVSPLAGSQHVRRLGDSYVRPEFVVGDWSNGATFQLGRDRLMVAVRLEALDAQRATFVTEFRPPRANAPSWPMHRPWMERPVCEDTPNNFQMVRKNGSQFLVVWGCEEFTVRNTVERESGRTIAGQMDNTLVWRVRMCSDEALSNCVDPPNLTRRRFVTLQLQ